MRRQGITGFIVLALLAGIGGGYLGARYLAGENGGKAARETAYERVMRTKTLRCGYVVDIPHVTKDPATGALSGVIVDVMNEAGRLLKLKVDWAEELGWGTTVEALRSGRVDAVCTDFWMEPLEGSYVGYSMPLYYGAMVVYVRADDHRFDGGLEAVNDPAVTVSVTDGEMAGFVVQEYFPKAKVLSMPNMTDVGQNLLNVASGKADVVFVDAMTGLRYERNNPGKLKRLTPDKPLLIFPATIALPQGDVALKSTLDSALAQLLNGGLVNKALEKYKLPADVTYRAAKPYEVPKAVPDAVLSGASESDNTKPTQ
ncbi:MAG: transporter substrate-binding domain-containing protein [Alphaproteobacteria bacterium]|nr:transporter substrate-binding domain-containing protein [Alphaproteobacteria bacterium]